MAIDWIKTKGEATGMPTSAQDQSLGCFLVALIVLPFFRLPRVCDESDVFRSLCAAFEPFCWALAGLFVVRHAAYFGGASYVAAFMRQGLGPDTSSWPFLRCGRRRASWFCHRVTGRSAGKASILRWYTPGLAQMVYFTVIKFQADFTRRRRRIQGRSAACDLVRPLLLFVRSI